MFWLQVGPIHPQPTQYAYQQCDYLFNQALTNQSSSE